MIFVGVSFRLPPMVFIHGDQAATVPLESTIKFVKALQATDTEVASYVIPKCGHADICLDLMDPLRTYHDSVMNIISNTVDKYL